MVSYDRLLPHSTTNRIYENNPLMSRLLRHTENFNIRLQSVNY